MALKQRDLEQLIARCGRENVLFSEADRIVYSTDAGAGVGGYESSAQLGWSRHLARVAPK